MATHPDDVKKQEVGPLHAIVRNIDNRANEVDAKAKETGLDPHDLQTQNEERRSFARRLYPGVLGLKGKPNSAAPKES